MKKFMAAVICAVIVFSAGFPTFAAGSISSTELNKYLAEINMTKSELDEYLAGLEFSLADFESVEDLKFTLGEPLTPASLQNFLKENELTEQELKDILVEYGELEEGESIVDNFHFISDLEYYVFENGYSDEEFADQLDDEVFNDMEDLFSEMGLEEEELNKLAQHFESLALNEAELEKRMYELGERMSAFDNIEDPEDVTPEQVAELISIYQEIADIFQIQFKFALVKNGVAQDISLQSLLNLDELGDQSLQVSILNLQGEKLVDFILTPEMLGSEIIQETGQDLKSTTKVVEKIQQHKAPIKTVKGAKLPKTAGNYLSGMLLGLLLIALTFGLMKKAVKVK
jgi:processed acidic surface protein